MTKSSAKQQWLLPDGVQEWLPNEAWRLESLRRQIIDTFRVRGYDLVIPPLIEYLDSLLTGTGTELDIQTFKTTDPITGRLLGVRPDITPQVARMDAHRLADKAVVRLCYEGEVLRSRPDEFDNHRALFQVGAELFGHDGLQADAEIFALMHDCLALAGVKTPLFDIGHVRVFGPLIESLDLPEEQETVLYDLIQAKAFPELQTFVDELDCSPQLKPVLMALPQCYGGRDAVDKGRALIASLPEGLAKEPLAALETLNQFADELAKVLPNAELFFDLAELHGYRYHTGLVFAAFIKGQGQAIARGGRYNAIGAEFGASRPATGFTTDLSLLTEIGQFDSVSLGEAIAAPVNSDESLAVVVSTLRAQGERVVGYFSEQKDADLIKDGCNRKIVNQDSGWQVVSLNN